MKAGLVGIFAVALVLAAISDARAQERAFPLPPLPRPPVALTVPHPLPPPAGAAGAVDLYRRPDDFRAITSQHQLPVFVPGPGFYGPGAVYVPIYVAAETTSNTRPQPAPQLGGLWLETQPVWAQVYVDGYYVGLVDDYGVRGRMLELRVGTHHIELRAAGYVSLTFDVDVALNQIIRYRGDRQRLNPLPSAAAATPSRGATAVYMVPKCYAGNRPPRAALPRGCDLARMHIIEPR